MLHLKKTPTAWKLSTKKLQTPTIFPSAFQLIVSTEQSNLDNIHMLNSYISARIDNCHFSRLENVWPVNSGANNLIPRDQANLSDSHLSSFKQIIWTGKGPAEVKEYGSVHINWITQNGKQVSIILTNVLHIPGIFTNFIILLKLDPKSIYCWSNDQTLCVIKIYKEVGA